MIGGKGAKNVKEMAEFYIVEDEIDNELREPVRSSQPVGASWAHLSPGSRPIKQKLLVSRPPCRSSSPVSRSPS